MIGLLYFVDVPESSKLSTDELGKTKYGWQFSLHQCLKDVSNFFWAAYVLTMKQQELHDNTQIILHTFVNYGIDHKEEWLYYLLMQFAQHNNIDSKNSTTLNTTTTIVVYKGRYSVSWPIVNKAFKWLSNCSDSM